jgi:hypothetical protein
MLRAIALALREAQKAQKRCAFCAFCGFFFHIVSNGRNYVEVCRSDLRSGGRRTRRPTARNAVTMGLRF